MADRHTPHEHNLCAVNLVYTIFYRQGSERSVCLNVCFFGCSMGVNKATGKRQILL